MDRAVDRAVRGLPVHSYGATELAAIGPSAASTPVECAVCLIAFAAGDQVKTLPCKHAFHTQCIDQWLLVKGRPQRAAAGESVRGLAACPLCKVVPIDVPRPRPSAGGAGALGRVVSCTGVV